jgi:hypothetical protein
VRVCVCVCVCVCMCVCVCVCVCAVNRRDVVLLPNSPLTNSLNREKRQRELQQVTQENKAILQRIQARQANYSHKSLVSRLCSHCCFRFVATGKSIPAFDPSAYC